ncbi:MAG: FAD-dependent oxidoreductase [Betaproteobacteria bacterium]|nr:FAD-dependent oxidoreductase [Betaproteobacteria bacterium]MDH5577761.1 FAD-dependent oxidoreductase [Betaproteobacteria bacterium]
MQSENEYDVIVVGAGAGGLTAACVAAAEGLKTLLVEKSPLVGGTAAVSGGMVWIPANSKMAAAGIEDSAENARRYLEQAAPPTRDTAVREAFLARGAEAIDYLEARTALRLQPVLNYPDYFPELPGATLGGRVLEPVAFDARTLRRDFARLRWPLAEFMLFGRMMIARPDLPHFRAALTSPRSAARVLRRLAEYAWQRLFAVRGTRLVLGNALVAHLLKSALELKVSLRLGAAVTRLVLRDGAAAGVEIEAEGKRETIPARAGVVLATGGFSHDAQRRKQLLPAAVSPRSPVCPTSTGDGLRLGLEAGGVLGTHNTQNAFWSPVSSFRRADGSTGVFPHTVADRGKPGIIAVTRQGTRFTSEAVSYHAFVLAMFRARLDGGSNPAFLLCDRRSLWQYGLGAVRPFALSLAKHIAGGYLTRASSITDLAARLEIDPPGLERTVETYNADARRGVDSQFGLGGDAYQRFLGDARNRPNPCMRPIETPPFYAIRLVPSDLGTVAGLATDAEARVLGADGQPVPRLYACGNDMNSIMDGAYPGPGIALGPALVFGYIAARALAQESPSEPRG